jgi:hypothetical protein
MKGIIMKKRVFLCLFAMVACLGMWRAPAFGVPMLQLDIANGIYDHSTETIIATDDPFMLYALLTPKTNASQADINALLAQTYYISIALVPQVEPPGGDYGAINFDGTNINVTADMVYGTAPLETILSNQGWDAHDLQQHGVFETYFVEQSFQFIVSDTKESYNSQDRAISGVSIPTASGDTYYASFNVSTLALSGYVAHFDLYSQQVYSTSEDVDVDDFAPFSHDAQSPSIPDPAAIFLLGSACLIGFAGARRKFKK